MDSGDAGGCRYASGMELRYFTFTNRPWMFDRSSEIRTVYTPPESRAASIGTWFEPTSTDTCRAMHTLPNSSTTWSEYSPLDFESISKITRSTVGLGWIDEIRIGWFPARKAASEISPQE